MTLAAREQRSLELGLDRDLTPTAPLSERAVLAAWLSTEHRPAVTRDLVEDDFTDPWHRELFNDLVAFDDLASGCGPLAVAEHMRKRGVSDTGKYADVMELWETAPQIASGDPRWFVANILEAALLRAEIELGKRIAANPHDATIAHAEHTERVADLQRRLDPRPDTSFRSHVIGASTRYAMGEVPATPTGLYDLDLLIHGLRPGGVVVVGARPGIGKSLLVTTFASNLCERLDTMVGFVSLEMDDAEVENRLIAGETKISVERLNDASLSQDDWLAFDAARDKMASWPLDIRCHSHSRADLRAFAEELKSYGKERTVLILDYIQRVREDDGANVSRERHVSMVSNTLKDIAVDLEIAVVAVASMSRELTKRGGRPKMSDLRDSGTIESDADVVLLLWQEDESMDSDRVDGVVDKNRHGRLGETKFVRRGQLGRMASMSRLGQVVD